MFIKKYLLFSLIVSLAFATSGCLSVKTGGNTNGSDGGFFKSTDQGAHWVQQSAVLATGGALRGFSNVDAISLTMDPGDDKAIYFGSLENGLFYTYDQGESWQVVKSLGQVSVTDVAVDPKNKCVIYAAIGNKIFKSEDCSRTWSQIYFDNNQRVFITDISIDHYDSNIIYAGIDRGEIIQSRNAGEGWKTAYRSEGSIKKIEIDPTDSRTVYAATDKKGLFKSSDQGETWTRLDEFSSFLKENKIGAEIMDMSLVPAEKNVVFVATFYGLLKSPDGGATWERIELIPPEKQAKINKLAVNPGNSKEIYYVTNTTFYRSIDGGESWATIQLPSTRAGWELLLDPQDSNLVYLGVRNISR